MFEPLAVLWQETKTTLPHKLRWPKFNFIAVHYCYLIGWAIVGSVLLYPAGIMDYIDSVFLAAGAATQSGLNTINLNDIYLYQQIVLFTIAMVTNPIFINTAVVFIRLYWFEKRFKSIVDEARAARKIKTISRSRSDMKDDLEAGVIRRSGVRGKSITVLHETTRANGMSRSVADRKQSLVELEKLGLKPGAQNAEPSPESSNGSSTSTARGEDEITASKNGLDDSVSKAVDDVVRFHLGLPPTLRRDVKFAEDMPPPREPEVARNSSDAGGMPERKDASYHVAFLQRQQKAAKSGGTLRIPGPRDVEKGEKPQELSDDEDSDPKVRRQQTGNTLVSTPSSEEISRSTQIRHRASDSAVNAGLSNDTHPAKRGITIDEPDHPRRHQADDDNADGDGDQADVHQNGKMLQLLHKATSPLRRRRTNTAASNRDGKSAISRTFSNFTTARSIGIEDSHAMPYLSWQPTIGRNSAFIGLTTEQREELGGIEYRALKTLCTILCCYFVGFHLLGLVALCPWIYNVSWRSIVVSDGINPGWWGVFTPASMFNDLGFTLTPDSMNSFDTAALPLFLGSFLILIGNTGFPCMLRFTIWVLSKLVPRGSAIWDELRFLLDHPRRCFTLLFPSKATWWLFWVLVGLNGLDLIFFIVLDINDETVTSIPPGYRVLAGWFQAASTRTAGFSCVNIANLHPAIQVSYMIMMYISVFPIAISVRRTNVYEEKSLGVWGGEEDLGDDDPSYVGQHLRRQLSFDLWYIFLGFFIICIVEGGRLEDVTKYAFTMFAVLFEIVSAYGTVGLSLGYPNFDTSFSGQFKVLSKLVIIAMMIRGRHRGLPYALDRAILLPSEKLHRKEAEDAVKRHGTVRRASFTPAAEDEATTSATEGALQKYRRTSQWKDGDLDENGLPAQHLDDHEGTGADDGAQANGSPMLKPTVHRHPTNISFVEPIGRTHTRRGSVGTTISSDGVPRRPRRGRSLSRVTRALVSGLSAGPTIPKED